MKKIILMFGLVVASLKLTAGDDFCGLRNNAFEDGEQIDFTIFYSVMGLYVNAGSASFTTDLMKLNNKPVYKLSGTGTSNANYDFIFKVRDKYESYIDTATMQPYRFSRNIDEGGFKLYESVTFNQKTNTAITNKGVYKVPNCVQDVLSSIYYARNMNFDGLKIGDKIPFNMFLDNETYNLYIKYLGREKIKTKYGKFNAIKFSPLLIKGTIFQGGEGMTVWVSDDANHIPLRIESPIVVGTIKVDMMSYENLRYPLTSLIKKN